MADDENTTNGNGEDADVKPEFEGQTVFADEGKDGESEEASDS